MVRKSKKLLRHVWNPGICSNPVTFRPVKMKALQALRFGLLSCIERWGYRYSALACYLLVFTNAQL